MVAQTYPEAGARPRPRLRAEGPRRASQRARPPRFVAKLGEPAGRAVRAAPGWLYHGYRRANAGDLAAAMAFNALIALVPTFLLLVSVAGLFLHEDQVLVTAVYASVWALPPSEARQALDTLLSARQNSSWFGASSLVGFAWIGMNFVGSVGRSMNHVYGVPNRSFVHERVRGFLVIIVFAALFLLASLAAVVPTFFVQRRVGHYFQNWLLASWRGQVISYGVAVVAALGLFVVLYRVVPNAGQRLRDVWPGTVTAALLFVVTVQVFPLYLRLIHSYNRYGTTFAFVSLLVAWMYVLSHVVLFGTHVNATYLRHCRRHHCPSIRLLPRRLRAAA